LKAARADYYPRLKDASAAYELAVQFIEEIRAYFNAHTLDS
jgi:membrane-bound lytic murein transglycosylase MltF